jgi:hypothetical protein
MTKRKKISVGILAAIITTAVSCDFIPSVKGNGDVVRQKREVASFSAIDLQGGYEVELRQGEKESLEIETDQNLLALISSEVENGTLIVEQEKNNIRSTEMILYITVRDINSIRVSGAVDMKGAKEMTFSKLNLSVSGAGSIWLAVKSSSLVTEIYGAGTITLKGESAEARIRIAGAGSVSAFGLQCSKAAVNIEGTGSAKVNVKDELDVAISGVGSVEYKGDPKVNKQISGMGSVKKS